MSIANVPGAVMASNRTGLRCPVMFHNLFARATGVINDRRYRVSDISAATFVLDQMGALVATPSMASVPDSAPAWKRLVAPITAAVATGLIVAPLVWFSARSNGGIAAPISRLLITPGAGAALSTFGSNLATTPDGSRSMSAAAINDSFSRLPCFFP